jgi:hypothetical protein
MDYLQHLDVDILLLTGDLGRHDRDSINPRTPQDITESIDIVTTKLKNTFKKSLIVPSIGNWDTRVISTSDKIDYEVLYKYYSRFWSKEQRALVFDSFLEGGYYVLHHHNISIISMNTLTWFGESSLVDCHADFKSSRHPGDLQFHWLFMTLRQVRKVILIGHVPPMTHTGSILYKPNCYKHYLHMLKEFQDVIVTLYFGHVNWDIAYLVTDGSSGTEITPITASLLKSGLKKELNVIGTMFTGPSIVPFFNPAFRIGTLKTSNGSIVLDSHHQYYVNLTRQNQEYQNGFVNLTNFYESSCGTKKWGLQSLEPSEWHHFLKKIQKKRVASEYHDCATVHTRVKISIAKEVITNGILFVTVVFVVGLLGVAFYGDFEWVGYLRFLVRNREYEEIE